VPVVTSVVRVQATLRCPTPLRDLSALLLFASRPRPSGNELPPGVKEQYLAVRSKADYSHVAVTEDVMETHICPECERRIRGTGNRG